MTPEEPVRVNTLDREIQVERAPARFLVLIEELTKLLRQRDIPILPARKQLEPIISPSQKSSRLESTECSGVSNGLPCC